MAVAPVGGPIERDQELFRIDRKFGGLAVDLDALDFQIDGIERELRYVIAKRGDAFRDFAVDHALIEIEPKMSANILQRIIATGRVRLVRAARLGGDGGQHKSRGA